MAYVGFDKLAAKLAARGAKDPKALAAYIGQKKYGKKKFKAAAAKGKKMKPDVEKSEPKRDSERRGG